MDEHIPQKIDASKNNHVSMSVDADLIKAGGDVLQSWQKQKDEGKLNQIKAELEAEKPLRTQEMWLRYTVLIIIISAVSFFSYIGFFNSQFTVALFSAILGYLFGQVSPDVFRRKPERNS